VSIRWRLLFPTLRWSINTKSMGERKITNKHTKNKTNEINECHVLLFILVRIGNSFGGIFEMPLLLRK
jgi:hypothetical protein